MGASQYFKSIKIFRLSVRQLETQPYLCGPVSSFITARPMANGREGGKLKMDEFGRPLSAKSRMVA